MDVKRKEFLAWLGAGPVGAELPDAELEKQLAAIVAGRLRRVGWLSSREWDVVMAVLQRCESGMSSELSVYELQLALSLAVKSQGATARADAVAANRASRRVRF